MIQIKPIALTFLSLGALLSGLSTSIAAEPHSNPKRSSIGGVINLEGKAWASERELKIGSELFNEDILKTGPDSKLHIFIGNRDGALLLKSNSLLQIVHSSIQDWMIDLKEGSLLSHFRHIKPLPRRFQIKTPTAVIGVRGTTLFMKQDSGPGSEKTLFLCTCHGIVAIDDKVIISGKNHDSPKLISPGTLPLLTRLKATDRGKDHTDAEGADLAKSIGSTP